MSRIAPKPMAMELEHPDDELWDLFTCHRSESWFVKFMQKKCIKQTNHNDMPLIGCFPMLLTSLFKLEV